MKRTKRFLPFSLGGLLALAAQASASSLVFTPQNPSVFPGASPLNNGMIQFQAGLSRPQRESSAGAGGLSSQTLASTVKNALLARVSSQIYNNIFGDNAQLAGNVSISDGSVIGWVTNPLTQEKTITITDANGSTSIVLPSNFGL